MISTGFRRSFAIAAALVVLAVSPAGAAAQVDRQPGATGLKAYLDGQPIPPTDVGQYYCDDFAYPVINCFSDPARLEDRVEQVLSATSITYVVIYDYTGYAGAYMYVSQDYTILALIGWNDRISSLRGVNYQYGFFYVDWFYSGTAWYFCCNWQFASLGSYDNTFSSVHRN